MDGKKKKHLSSKNGKNTKLRRRKKIAKLLYTRHHFRNVMDFWAYLIERKRQQNKNGNETHTSLISFTQKKWQKQRQKNNSKQTMLKKNWFPFYIRCKIESIESLVCFAVGIKLKRKRKKTNRTTLNRSIKCPFRFFMITHWNACIAVLCFYWVLYWRISHMHPLH